jgi:cation diffusion facilitator family transporter
VSKTTTPTAISNLESGMKLALLGIGINAVLSIVKLLAGYFGHSYALIADGIESSLDITSSFIIWTALKVATKPPDADHPYGHGKAEPVAAIIVGFAVLFAAVGLAAESVREILTPHHAPAPFTLVVLVVVIITKEILYRIVMWQGNKMGSTAVKADAGHHRSDAITSFAALVGISIALIGGKGWEPADDWAALLACGLIAINGFNMLKPAVYEIMDTAPPKDFEDNIRHVAESVPGVQNVQQCRIRKMGVEFYVDLHIWVDGSLSVLQGHNIAHAVKDAVRESNPAVADVLVHVEPSIESAEASSNSKI